MSSLREREEAYITFKPKVERYIKNRVQNISDAEELVSEVFEKVISSWELYDKEKALFSTWIYTITRNTVCDYYRKKGKTIPFAQVTDAIIDDIADKKVLLEEQLNGLAEALERLPAREREILILRFYYELPHKEIAQKMGLSYSNVRYLQFTALRKLKEFLLDTK